MLDDIKCLFSLASHLDERRFWYPWEKDWNQTLLYFHLCDGVFPFLSLPFWFLPRIFPKKLYRKFMLFLELLLVCFVYTTGTTHPMGCICSPGLQPHRFAEMAAHTLSLSHLLMKKIIDVTLWLLPNFISCVSKKINEFFYHVCFKIAPAWKVRFMFNHVLFTI